MKSLLSIKSPLASHETQLRHLSEVVDESHGIVPFHAKASSCGSFPLRAAGIDVLQVNLGKMCNQTCIHCHVDAGPDRKEIMDRETLESCLEVLKRHKIPTVDLTGGAPEMHPHFRWFVRECSRAGIRVMDRCNLTIILANKKYHDLPRFLAENRVEVVCSLPFYNADRTDRQRGKGVFADSISALRLLNEAGYGREGTGLVLNLVYNPSGTLLPASQKTLESQFRKVLLEEFSIVFNSLFAITNMPISRFLDYLIQSGSFTSYMERLVNAFNPATLDGLMCRNTVSVSWDGFLHDCDFNQMLGLTVENMSKNHIRDFDKTYLEVREIVVSQHCYGCTAGAGSSCGGELAGS